MASLAHKMAIVSDSIRADVVEVNEFTDLVRRYRIRGVPKVVINDSVEFEGPLPEGAFVARVLSAIGTPPAS